MTDRVRSAAIESLDSDHRLIEKVLTAMERFSQSPGLVPDTAWAQALEFLGRFADDLHHAKEEEVLFPELVKHGLPADGGPVACMLHEHARGRELRQAMAAALAALGADPEPVRRLGSLAREYVELLRFHIQKEDNVLFPLADQLLDEGARRQVFRRFTEVVEQRYNDRDVAHYVVIAGELASVAVGMGPAPAPAGKSAASR